MAELYANAIPTTLASAITAGATSLTVNSAAGFPASGNFRIKIDSEIIIVGAVAGAVFSSLTRGAESTTAAAHIIDSPVIHVITKGALDQIIVEAGGPITFPAGTRKTFGPDSSVAGLNVGSVSSDPSTLVNGDIWYNSTGNALKARINSATVSLGAGGGGATIGTGTDASKPTTPAGDLYLPNNGFQIYRPNGSSAIPWGPIFPFTAPVDGDFAWINQGGASVTTTNGGIYLAGPAGAGNNLRIRKKAAPSAPYKIEAAFLPNSYPIDNTCMGLLFRNSGAGTIAMIRLVHVATDGGFVIYISKWTNATTFSANYAGPFRWHNPGIIYFRIQDDNTNRISEVSGDGQNWITLHSVGRTDFLTADEVGFGVESFNATGPANMTLLHWKQS